MERYLSSSPPVYPDPPTTQTLTIVTSSQRARELINRNKYYFSTSCATLNNIYFYTAYLDIKEMVVKGL
jgi:predicted S18 family serine protease